MIAMLTTLMTLYISQNNIITILIGIEILLLTITVKIIYLGGIYDDITSTIYSIFIIILAGAESAIGLSLLVSYYRLRGNITNIL